MRSSHGCVCILSILSLMWMLFLNWRLLLLIIHTRAWWSLICWSSSWSTTWTYHGVLILRIWHLAARGLHSVSLMETMIMVMLSWLSLIHMTESTRVLILILSWRSHLIILHCILLRSSIRNLYWTIPKRLKNWFWVCCRSRLCIMCWMFTTANLLHWIAVSDHHAMVIRQHIVMELWMLVLTHTKWWISWLRPNLGCGFRSCVLLKLWRHLVMTWPILGMFIIWWILNSLINLMSSNMSTWSTIIMSVMVNSMSLIILCRWFWSRARSICTIYSILVASTALIRRLFLARETAWLLRAR